MESKRPTDQSIKRRAMSIINEFDREEANTPNVQPEDPRPKTPRDPKALFKTAAKATRSLAGKTFTAVVSSAAAATVKEFIKSELRTFDN